MKPTPFIIALLLVLPFFAKAQLSDTMVSKKLTVNGFCLCKTTLENLKQSYADLKEIDVEEMDLAKSCFGQDSRFIATIGYASDKQPGIIFQKDQQSDYVGKIRLTKQFKGNFPADIQVYTADTIPKPKYNSNMELLTYDVGLGQQIFIMAESSKVKSYDYRANAPFDFPNLSPFLGKQYQQLMKQTLEWIFDYKIYTDNPGMITLSCHFKKLKPKSAMALPSYILVDTEALFEINYTIKSNESAGSLGTMAIG